MVLFSMLDFTLDKYSNIFIWLILHISFFTYKKYIVENIVRLLVKRDSNYISDYYRINSNKKYDRRISYFIITRI